MKPEDKHRLSLNWTYLEANLEADAVVELCMDNLVLDPTDRERIKAEKSRPDRALKLLSVLMGKDDDSVYDKLLKALDDAEQPELRKRLQDTVVPRQVLEQDKSEEQVVVDVLKECLVEQKDKECSVQKLFDILHLQLQRWKHYVHLRSVYVYDLLKIAFPSTKLRKNKRKNVVAVVNCTIRPDFLQFAESSHEDETEEGPGAEEEASGDRPGAFAPEANLCAAGSRLNFSVITTVDHTTS